MASTPQGPPPGAPFDPTNRNDPRYDPRRDPSNDPRWQREQRRNWERAQKAQQQAWRDQQRFAARTQRDVFRRQTEVRREQMRAWVRTHRAPSIVGPLVLIAFAVTMLLVYNGRISWPALLTWYSHWWPLLLIIFGVLRIAEWAFERATRREGQPALRYTVGGGLVFLAIAVTLSGLAVQGTVRAGEAGFHFGGPPFNMDEGAWRHFLGSKHEEDAPAITRAIGLNAVLSIDSAHGDVTVSGISDDGMIHVATHKEVFANSDSTAQDRLRDLNPQFGGDSANVSLKIASIEGGRADLNVLIPPTVHLVVNADRGDVHATNMKVPVVLTANRGDVEAAAITGNVTAHVNSRRASLMAHSISGNLDVQGSGDEVNVYDVNGSVRVGGDFFGGGRLQRIAGPVDFHTGRVTFGVGRLDGEVTFDNHDEFSATGATGPLTLDTRSRDVTLSRIAGDIRVTNNHGKVDIVSVPPNGSITIDNHDGDVVLSLPQQAHFTVIAETSDGSVTSNFPGLNEHTQQSAHGTISATVGGGGSPIRINTTHGDITIDRNAELMPPRPPAPPRLGFGTVPVPSSPTMPPEAVQALQDAQKEIQEAQRDSQKDVRDAANEAAKAMQFANEKQVEARRLADQARQQAKAARKQAEQETHRTHAAAQDNDKE